MKRPHLERIIDDQLLINAMLRDQIDALKEENAALRSMNKKLEKLYNKHAPKYN
jgi:hypothetical protein